MPKRKLTPARRAAIVKWQLAGARARAEKAGKFLMNAKAYIERHRVGG